MATRTARAALETSLSVLFAGALVLGLSSSAALAAGNRAASSGAADRPVVLLPDDEGPHELVMDEDDEEWDEDLETDDATGEDADDGESVIGDAVQRGGRPARGRGRATATAPNASAGPRAKTIPAKVGPVSSPGSDQDVTLLAGPASAMAAAGTSASTLGAPAAGVLGTSLERPASPVLPPAELFAAPARHITGGAAEVPSLPEGQGPAAMTLAGALLAVGVLGAGSAATHRPRS